MRGLLAGALLAFASAALSAPSVYLEDLTSPELRDQVRAGKTIALVPIGGTEQNGAHMALGKHNVRARILAGRIATELGNAIVAPVIAYVPEGNIDPPTEHMKHPGTITIPADVFEKTLESAAKSLAHHGFRDIVFLGDHGGYQRNVETVAARLNRAWARQPARAHALVEYYTAAGLKGHAGDDDTSFTLALEPSMVREPGAASAETGKKTAEAVISRSVAAIRRAVRR
jgi:creatinine amidohydrolase